MFIASKISGPYNAELSEDSHKRNAISLPLSHSPYPTLLREPGRQFKNAEDAYEVTSSAQSARCNVESSRPKVWHAYSKIKQLPLRILWSPAELDEGENVKS